MRHPHRAPLTTPGPAPALRRLGAALLPFSLAFAMGCAHQRGAAPGEAEGEAAAAEAPPSPGVGMEPTTGDGSQGIVYPEPPDGEWLVDEEGREYYVVEIPKDDHSRRIGEDQVGLPWGLVFDLAGEREDVFLAKIYRMERPEPAVAAGPSPEEVAAVEESYRAELPEARTLGLRPFDEGLPRSGMWRNRFAIADVDGDGHPDIVHLAPRRQPRPPVIFLGDGKGGWRHWEEATFPRLPWDYGGVAVGDITGDGHVDLAAGIHLTGLAVVAGDGAGSFREWGRGLRLERPGQQQPGIFSSRAVLLVDWNRNGLLDLVALSEGPVHARAADRERAGNPTGLRIYLNQGDGSWQRHQVEGWVPVFGDHLVAADFTGNGWTDLATASSVMGLRRIVWLGGPDGAQRAVDVPELRPVSAVWAVAAADFDGDGRDDLVVSYTSRQLGVWRTGVDLLLSREGPGGELGWERRPLIAGPDGPERVTALAAGDLEGNGLPDLVGTTSGGALRLLRGLGEGRFARELAPEEAEAGEGCRGYHVALADLDGDGRLEVVAGFAGADCPGQGSLRAWKSETLAGDP